MTKAKKKLLKLRWKLLSALPHMSKEEIYKLSLNQLEFIFHSIDKSCFLNACPGSGKTEVVGIKTALEVSKWEKPFSGIAILSFTKNAAKEIADRVLKYSNTGRASHPHYIGTIDAWTHGYIFQPHGYREFFKMNPIKNKGFSLVEDNSKAGFLHSYKMTKSPGHDIFANEYYLNQTGKPECNKDSKLDGFRVTSLESLKVRFLEDGFSTYQDAEYISCESTKKIASFIAQRFPVIIIDECQDLSYSQLLLFHELKQKGCCIHMVGDLNQSIYEFRKVFPEKVKKYIKKNNYLIKLLPQNFRSNPLITSLCTKLGRILSKNNNYKIVGERSTVEHAGTYYIGYDNLDEVIGKFEVVLNCLKDDCKKNPTILVRSRSLIGKLGFGAKSSKQNTLEQFANVISIFNDKMQMEKAISQFGKLISRLGYDVPINHQSHYCPSGIHSIRWRIYLSELLSKAYICLFPFGDRTWTSWGKELKDFLEGEWDTLPNKNIEWNKAKTKLRAPNGKRTDLVQKSIGNGAKNVVVAWQNNDGVRITTIHDVKGETLNAVMLVSSPDKKSKTGHVTQWISTKEKNSEAVRLAFVASSRPKHLLVWAIPNKALLEKGVAEKLGSLGLIEYNLT